MGRGRPIIYNNADDKHKATLASKKQWYQRNKQRQQLRALMYYQQNKLKKDPNDQEAKEKLNEINEKLEGMKTLRKHQFGAIVSEGNKKEVVKASDA